MSEQISERHLGQDEEQETVYEVASYAALAPETEGRWFVLEGKALVWTDDVDGAGIAWVSQTEENQRLWRHFQLSKTAGVPAGVAYQLALNSVGDQEEQSGALSGANSAFENMMPGS